MLNASPPMYEVISAPRGFFAAAMQMPNGARRGEVVHMPQVIIVIEFLAMHKVKN